MKIYFRNRADRLKRYDKGYSCERCPFRTSTIIDCYCKGHWVDGESLNIFRV